MGITREEIEFDIKSNKLKTFEGVGEVNGSGTMCGGCKEKIDIILKNINK